MTSASNPSSSSAVEVTELKQHIHRPADWAHSTVMVLGAGNFGTCLAYHLANVDHVVNIYARDQNVVESINVNHKNPKYLTAVVLPPKLSAINKLDKETVDKFDVLLFAIPTEHLRSVLQTMKPFISQDHLLIFANKGIEISSLSLPYVVVEEVLGKEFAQGACFLSGPSFASEVVSQQPTSVVVASKSAEHAHWAQEIFHAPQFRVYTSDDPIGVEVAGALKNVIAIGSGIASGLGFQMNTRAALLTRGLGEITLIGVALGANPITFMGLSGIGDLFLTCTSEKSRNFTVGYRMGKGESLEHILATLGSTAEGVTTAKAAYQLAQKLKVDVPIINEVYAMLHEKKPIREAVLALLTRMANSEHRFAK